MNDLNENTLNPNCFEKTKERGAFFLFFLPQMLKRRTSALLPITFCVFMSGGHSTNLNINRKLSASLHKHAVIRSL